MRIRKYNTPVELQKNENYPRKLLNSDKRRRAKPVTCERGPRLHALRDGVALSTIGSGASLRYAKSSCTDSVVRGSTKAEQRYARTRLPNPTDRLKEQFFERSGKHKRSTCLAAARAELAGVVTGFDHVTKVRNAQQGLVNRIREIQRSLGDPDLPLAERTALQKELSEASRLLDYTAGFVGP